MPTYGYECKSCGHAFDAFQKMTDDPLKSCPACGKAIRRLINGGSGVIFKGGGFYVTDRSASGAKNGSGGKSAAPANTAGNAAAVDNGASGGTASDKSPKTGGENAPASASPKPESPAHPKAANS